MHTKPDIRGAARASTATGLRVRRATPDDAERLSAIARAAKARWGYSQEWLAQWGPELTLLPEYLASHIAFVAERRGEPVGVCALEDAGIAWSLEHVWVRPDAAGAGIGRALVQAALDAAMRAHAAPVHVVSDPHAAGFYTRLGAIPSGTVPAPMPGAPHRTLPCFVFVPGSDLYDDAPATGDGVRH